MKKLLTLLTIFAFVQFSKAQYVTIPDVNFRNYLKNAFYYTNAFDAFDRMDTTNPSVIGTTDLDLTQWWSGGGYGIIDLTGIKYFKSLNYLKCSNNPIASLDSISNKIQFLYANNINLQGSSQNVKLPDSLRTLEINNAHVASFINMPTRIINFSCVNNGLSTLNPLPTSLISLNISTNNFTNLPSLTDSLQILNCSHNQITTIQSLPLNLTKLECFSNSISNINQLNNKLRYINCSFNNLTSVPYSITLTNLYCNNNQISSLSSYDSLLELNCSNNLISALPTLSNTLTLLSCNNNSLTALPILPITLLRLQCNNNSISSLPNLPSDLFELYCNNNLLTILPTIPNEMRALDCSHNQLTSITNFPISAQTYWYMTLLDVSYNNLTSLPDLNKNVEIFNCSHNQLTTLPKFNSVANSIICSDNLISCIDILPQGTIKLDITNTNVSCMSYIPNGLIVTPSSITSCNATNNTNSCKIVNPNVTIPDPNFRAILMQSYYYKACFNANQELDTICASGSTNNNLDCRNQNIQSIYGIHYFKNLTFLNVADNDISNIDSLPSTLTNIYCYNNKITAINHLPNSLQYIQCSDNLITNIDSLPVGLKSIGCDNNSISSVSKLPLNLEDLSCSGNNISNVDSLPKKLIWLNCNNNNITSVDKVSDSVKQLYCSKNLITQISKWPKNLQELDCSFNSLTSLPKLDSNITSLNCSHNNISNLIIDSFTTMPYYYWSNRTLNISYNQFNSLPILGSYHFSIINCRNNNITSASLSKFIGLLEFIADSNKISNFEFPSQRGFYDSIGQISLTYNNLYCIPKIPRGLNNFYIDSGKITCIPNIPNGYWFRLYSQTLTPLSLPVCNPTNNNNQCVGFPTIIGKVFMDLNKNGVKDIGENYMQWQSIKTRELGIIGDTAYCFTNANGVYAYTFEDTGKYSVKYANGWWNSNFPALLPYPDSIKVEFHRYDTTAILQDIAMQPTKLLDSVFVNIQPIWRSRMGLPFGYYVNYQNFGTTTQSPTITIKFDDTKLIFDSSKSHNFIQNGNILTLNVNNLQPYSYYWDNWDYLYFHVKTGLVLGDTLKTFAAVSYAAKLDSVPVDYRTIRNSYDPNEKDATPTLSTTQVALGKAIKYTVHFQNTGNDTAYNVVIADTLSNLLQANTMQVIASSHNVKTTLKNGIIYFEFLNIYLPDSGTNQIKSNGFITFTILPICTVSAGTNIYNKAAIYFDYNDPIITNNALTQIVITSILPLKFVSYDLKVANSINASEKQVNNLWTTVNETNVSHYNIQRSVNGRNFEKIASVKAKNALSNEYSFIDNLSFNNSTSSTVYYKIEGININGEINYSPIKSFTIQPSLNISIFPNPAKSVININCNEASSLTLHNTLGQVVITTNLVIGKNKLNISSLAKGIYVAVISNKTTNTSTKIIVE